MYAHVYFTNDIVTVLQAETNEETDVVSRNFTAFLSTKIPSKLGFPDPVRLHTTISHEVTNEDLPETVTERFVTDNLTDGGTYVIVASLKPFDRERVMTIRNKVTGVLEDTSLAELSRRDLLLRTLPEQWDDVDFCIALASFIALTEEERRYLVSLTLTVGEANTEVHTIVYREKGTLQ